MRSKWIKIVVFALLLIFYASLLTYKIQLPNADDMARHVKNGELIIHGNFDILTKNVYSYTQPDYPVVNHHWLAGVVYYLLLQVVGWSGLVVFKVILLLATFSLLFWLTLKRADFWLVALASIPTIIILSERTSLRPENFSYLFIVLFLYLLLDLEEHPESKKIWWLIPLQVLWVNIHIFFFVGVALTGGFLAEKLILNYKEFRENLLIKKSAILLVGLVAVCFLNPNFARGAFYPLNIFHNYGVPVSENVPLLKVLESGTFWGDYAVALYIPFVAILLLSFVYAFWKKQKPLFIFLASISAAIAGFMLVRAVTLFGLMLLPALALTSSGFFSNLKNRLETEVPRMADQIKNFLIGVLIIVLVGLTLLFNKKIPEPGIGLTNRSLESAQFFQEQNLKGPIFNDYDAGSYLAYSLFPTEKVWVDNRPEAYAESFFTDLSFPMLEDEGAWQQALQKYNFNTIFFYQYDQGFNIREFFWKRARDPDWGLVYVDRYNIIFVRNVPENKNVLDRFAITYENAEERLAHLVDSKDPEDIIAAADTFNLVGLSDIGTKTFLDVLSKFPDYKNKGKIWMVLGEWELSKNDERSPILAAMFLDKAISEGWKTSETYSFLGAAYVKLNRPDNARDALERSLQINPERRDARELLDQLNEL